MGDKSPADKSKMSGGDSQEKVNDKDGLVPSLDLNVLDATPDKIGGGDGEEGKFGLGTQKLHTSARTGRPTSHREIE